MRTRRMDKSLAMWVTTALCTTLAMTLTVETASAQDCKRADGSSRPCTTSQKAEACIDNAIEVYHECTDKGGLLNDIKCFVRYEIDFWGCVPEVMLPK